MLASSRVRFPVPCGLSSPCCGSVPSPAACTHQMLCELPGSPRKKVSDQLTISNGGSEVLSVQA